MAARPVWSGVIGFGLVQVPVGLHSAEAPGEDLSFSLLDAKDHAPVGYKHVNKVTGEEVPKERRVKGYEVKKGEYVVLSDKDFKAANVKATETIEIHSFVDVEEIPRMRLERPYWLAPTVSKQHKGAKPYVLLRDALQMTGKVALATIVLRARQSLCVVFPQDGALALQMLRYDDELAKPEDKGLLDDIEGVACKPAEIQMAAQLVEGMAGAFDTAAFHDTYKDDLAAIIEQRKSNPEHVPEVPKKQKAPAAEVVDLMALLKRSVEERGEQPKATATTTTRKPTRTRTAHRSKKKAG